MSLAELCDEVRAINRLMKGPAPTALRDHATLVSQIASLRATTLEELAAKARIALETDCVPVAKLKRLDQVDGAGSLIVVGILKDLVALDTIEGVV